ncbi:MAG: glycoside hydrolase family 130 protein [Janthinobacterium lividum]
MLNKVLKSTAILGGVLFAVALPVQAQQPTATPFGAWTRPVTAPVIAPKTESTFHDPVSNADVHWEALHTFNPAAVVRGGKVYVLYRAEDDSGSAIIGGHTSRLGLASSTDGLHFTREPEPVLFPTKDGQLDRESPGGVEDPRIVEAPDGTYVLTYTQWSRARKVYSVGIATSPDLRHWTKQGPAFRGSLDGRYDEYKYKSAAIVTELRQGRLVAAKINGKFWMYWGDLGIRLASSPDLVHWTPLEDSSGKPRIILAPRPGMPDSDFPEAGPPPVLTRSGIVMLYNAKNKNGEGSDPQLKPGTYSVEVATFAAEDPGKLVSRTVAPVFKPELPFEQTGQYAARTTFSEGLVLFKGRWWMYYGCADSFVGVATAPEQ